MHILSFDLGDFNAPSAWYSVDRNTGECRHGKVNTDRESLLKLFRTKRPDRVLCEACTMACLLEDVTNEALPDAVFRAANTNDEAWKWTNTKRKTDPSDAERLERLDRLGELKDVVLPDKEMRSLRRMLNHRHNLLRKRTACYNAIRHCCKQHEHILPKAEEAWSDAGLKAIEELCASVVDVQRVMIEWDTSWLLELHHLVSLVRLINQQLKAVEASLTAWRKSSKQVQRLQSAPGVGPLVSCAILAYIGDPHRFKKGKQVAAYAGLVPRVYQSGKECRHGRITKAGNKLLRNLLINAAWVAIRKDPWAQEVFNRVSGGCKNRRKQAIVAVARRLLVRCWAMMRDKQSWPKNPDETTEGAAIKAA